MLIKVKRNWKDYAEFCKQKKLSRREMMLKSMASGAISVLLPDFVAQNLAHAAPNCPAPVRVPGAIGQIFSEGGATMGARFISEAQAAVMNAGMAANYGISGQANLRKLGPNLVIDTTSPFGFTILQGPPGYPGGAAAWQTNVLSKISGGAHLGPFNADDGAGVDTGLIGGVSPFKVSTMGKDLRVNARNAPATWANGLPAAGVGNNVTPAAFASTFSLTPAANGLINSAALTASSEASNALADALGSVFNTSGRKGASQLMQAAGCGFFGNSALADPNYGQTLFNPTNIAALTAKTTVAQLTTKEQALLAAYYQSAMGVAGGVIVEYNGRDYHGQNVQTDITPKDIEEARAIVMFLAACDAAQAKGAMIYVSNGQAIADGVQAVTATINGAAANINGPVASGDAGGAYNAGLMIFFDPAGAPPAAKFTGTVTAASGNAKIDPNVGSSKEAMAGLYISALSWIGGGSVPASAMTAIKGAGLKGTATLI
jgi:hypothetical protein